MLTNLYVVTKFDRMIESVWDSREAAELAIDFYTKKWHENRMYYRIIERPLNQLENKQ